MSIPDYRALLQRLVNAIDAEPGDVPDLRQNLVAAYNDAFQALQTSPPKWPTDKELSDLLFWQFTRSTGHGEREDAMGFAIAVLKRWGNIPQPEAQP